MRLPWSSILTFLAAAVIAQACVGVLASTAGAGSLALSSDAEKLDSASILLPAALEGSSQAWLQFRQWIDQNYARAPALMLGLSVLLAIPPLALAGLLARRNNRRTPESTVMIPRRARRAKVSAPSGVPKTEISPWPTEAWVEIEGPPGGRHVIGRTLIRIGREEDNDIRLQAKTVHRYHAVIRRTTDGVVVITDLSGADGNGVLVNGARVAEARLAKGDLIKLGEIKMRFDARPA